VSPTVLVVEDEADLLFTISLALELCGYAVLPATSGEEALDLLAGQEPDAVVLDIRLPGMDGWEVVRRMGQLQRTSRIPVVILSAQVDSATAARAAELGCHGYLPKPFSAVELSRTLQTATGGPRPP
jgi:CheY-like chemotaxis protein